MGFNGNIKKDLDANNKKLVDAFYNAIEEEWIVTAGNIIDDTPEGIPTSERYDGTRKGNTKFNWQIGKSVNSRVLKGVGRNGREYAEKRIRGKLAGKNDLYLFNNKPNIKVLEFGGYPNPVKQGTYRRGRGYEKRSSGGYSRQAPHGMVRRNLSGLNRRIGRRIDKAWSRIK